MSTPSTHTSDTISGSWQLDPERSSVEFRVPVLWGLLTVKGHFDDYEGRLDLSDTPAIELTIDAASLQTDNDRRDRHLRSSDFFDAKAHPEVRFVSDAVDLQGDALKVRGRLAARGRSIPLELSADVRQVDGELEIAAAAIAPHRELGMTWSPLGIIPGHSDLVIQAHLIPDDDDEAA
jgi:polyisoprenoid-binding protein YceI